MEMTNVSSTPLKALSKAPKVEALITDENKPTDKVKNNNKATSNMAHIEVANESDDDDSVFINENKPKKTIKTSAKHKSVVQPAPLNAPSVMLLHENVLSSKIKPVAPVAAQIQNSRDLNVHSETVVR